MNMQIFGRNECLEVKEAEWYFKERGVRFQSISLNEKEMSRGEFTRVKQAVGGLKNMTNQTSRNRDLLALIQYIAQEDREEGVFENQKVLKIPIVRDVSQATVGHHPEIWKTWEQDVYLGVERV